MITSITGERKKKTLHFIYSSPSHIEGYLSEYDRCIITVVTVLENISTQSDFFVRFNTNTYG